MRLAARGARELDHGPERVTQPEDRAALRGRARHVHVRSVLLATFGTILALAFRLLVALSR